MSAPSVPDTPSAPAAAVPARRGTASWIVCGALLLAAGLAWVLPQNEDAEARLWRTYRITNVLVALGATAVAAAALYLNFGPGDAKRRAFRVVLVTLSTGFCLLLVEIPALVLRHDWAITFGTRPADTWLQVAGGINRPDPELIHVHKPHDVWEGSVAGNLEALGLPALTKYPVSLKYDRNGFRNDHDLDRAEVVAIGDSFVEAAIIPREKTACARLETLLGTPVANLGQEAYGMRQELAVLRRYGLPLRPRVVLWFLFGGNDLRDVADYEEALRILEKGPAPRPLRDRSFVANALLALSAATTPARKEPSAVALSHSGMFQRADGVRERVYFGDGADPYDAHSLEVATQTLGEAAKLTREAGAKFVVVYVTRKFRVYRRHVEIAPGSEASTWEPGDLPEKIAAWAAKNDVLFVDPTAACEREVAAGRHAYLVDDVHWNEAGHDLAAREVAAALAATGWKAEGPK